MFKTLAMNIQNTPIKNYYCQHLIAIISRDLQIIMITLFCSFFTTVQDFIFTLILLNFYYQTHLPFFTLKYVLVLSRICVGVGFLSIGIDRLDLGDRLSQNQDVQHLLNVVSYHLQKMPGAKKLEYGNLILKSFE